MGRLSVASWIGNAAAVLGGGWGTVSRQARQAQCSRQTAYRHAAEVEQAVAGRCPRGPTRQQLLEENRRLREENQQLWQWLDESVEFPTEKRQQFTVTASAMGLSLRQVLCLLSIILPAGQAPSRSTLGRWVEHWSTRASEILQVIDRACKHLVLVFCLDEIFFRRQPVLVGVEPHSMAWLIGRKVEKRDGRTWYEALLPWDRLEYVNADGGTGLEKGLWQLQVERREDAEKPDLEVGLDVFHTKKEALPVIHRLWKKVEGLWQQAEKLDREVANRRWRGKSTRGVSRRARNAWKKAEAAFVRAERIEAAWQRAEAALSVFRPDGRLNNRAWAEAEIAAALEQLTGSEWAKVRRMLDDRRTLVFLDRMHRQLQESEPNEQLREALVRLWWLRRQRSAKCPHDRRAGLPAVHVVQAVLCQRIDPNWQRSYRRVVRVLHRVVRASSVVECMNSVIRMHQARHRTLTQPLMDLKRLWWNCRPFAEGKRRHRCPYQHLGLPLPTHDFWRLLQADPAKLAQELST